MEIQTLITLVQPLLLGMLALVAYNHMYLVFKLKGIDPSKTEANNANGVMFLLF
ncbi:MAG: hypothetical protein R3B47_20470 [Bacteroidia bacterium]